jgi:hypothetical protein
MEEGHPPPVPDPPPLTSSLMVPAPQSPSVALTSMSPGPPEVIRADATGLVAAPCLALVVAAGAAGSVEVPPGHPPSVPDPPPPTLSLVVPVPQSPPVAFTSMSPRPPEVLHAGATRLVVAPCLALVVAAGAAGSVEAPSP